MVYLLWICYLVINEQHCEIGLYVFLYNKYKNNQNLNQQKKISQKILEKKQYNKCVIKIHNNSYKIIK